MKYLERILRIYSVISNTLPEALADGKIDIMELIQILSQILTILEIDISIEIPEEIQGVALAVLQPEDMKSFRKNSSIINPISPS